MKSWDARLIVQVHVSCDHHLQQVSPTHVSRSTWDSFWSSSESNRLGVCEVETYCIHLTGRLLPCV